MAATWGRVAQIDLTSDHVSEIDWPEELQRRELGGVGLGTRLLSDAYASAGSQLEAGDPRIPLLLTTGPMQGTRYPGSGKWMAVSTSPLTRTVCMSGAGGDFGVKLKQTGFDALFITGCASSPTYVLMTDSGIEVRDAKRFWGRDAIETCELLRTEHQAMRPSVLAIGQAGELEVAIACLVVDGHSFAGRGGLGAVMGAKQLKAVVVSGQQAPQLADAQLLNSLTREDAQFLAEATRATMRQHGTPQLVVSAEAEGDLPLRYWMQDTWPEGARKIGAPRYTEYLSARPRACAACPIGCHREIDAPSAGSRGIKGAGPEYEALGLLGGACLVDDLVSIAQANDVCNRLGIDVISAGAYAAFSMLCLERGLLSATHEDSADLTWGNGQALVRFVRSVGLRQGLGELFSSGIREAAREIGQEAPDLAVEVKGLDFPAHDPRRYYSLAINYATSPKGASHLRGFPHCGEAGMLLPEAGYEEVTPPFTMEGKASLTKIFQDYAAALDSLVLCCFMPINGLALTSIVSALNAATGWELSAHAVLEAGERTFNLQRVLNQDLGVGAEDDRLPKQVFRPATEGYREGRTPDPFPETLQEYYSLRGWSDAGTVTQATLERLKIDRD